MIHKSKFIFWFVLLISLSHKLDAKRKYDPEKQMQPKFSIEASLYGGSIIKHTPRFVPTITQPSGAFELSFSKTSFGNNAYERKFNYPLLGASIIAIHYGDNQIFGDAIGAFPHVLFFLKRSQVLDFYFRMGIGLVYVTKPYDINTNSTNNVIGSYLNNITQFKFGIDWKLAPSYYLNTQASFTHVSNAHSQNPNLGINFGALGIGLKKNFGVAMHTYNKDSLPKNYKKNHYTLGFAIGILEKSRTAYGPFYPAFNYFIQYNRSTSIANQIHAGVSLVYNTGTYSESLYRENNESSIKNKTINALEGSIYIGDEIIFNHFGFFADLGIYVFQPFRYSNVIYQKLGGNYYFNPLGKKKILDLFIGANLKSHMGIAENFEIRSGLRF